MFVLAHGGEQSFAQEFAQFGILLAKVLGDFAEFPSEGNLRVGRRAYLSDASCRFVTIALHGAFFVIQQLREVLSHSFSVVYGPLSEVRKHTEGALEAAGAAVRPCALQRGRV